MDDALGTAHGDLRLLQRAGTLDKSLTELWDESIPCEVKYHGYDEARVSAEYGVVLLKEDGRIVTCLNETHNVTIPDEQMEAYLDDGL